MSKSHSGAIWTRLGSVYRPADEATPSLTPGFYEIRADSSGIYFVHTVITTDNLIAFDDGADRAVIDEFAAFWPMRERFRQHGFLHKRGILLWGAPGTGKTSALMLMAKQAVLGGGIVLRITNAKLAAMALRAIRTIEPDRPIVCLLEDFEKLADDEESEYLALLDGQHNVDHVVFVATTNYPDKLDKRFTDRPSRFDLVKEIGYPSANARRAYLLAKMPDVSNVDEWVALSDGYSIAHLREFIVLVQCFGLAVPAAAARLDALRNGAAIKEAAAPAEPVAEIPTVEPMSLDEMLEIEDDMLAAGLSVIPDDAPQSVYIRLPKRDVAD
jgi:hypothetical protein